ncbi:EscU/YscU/HrcU family type III secretion system export apparatus switch protein [Oceanospirillum linum]|uniref:Flagellar biosynthetic protein FlhB n=1 Tax=Oceanospirillum linum TaxID=966 RepID=A0A1T1HFC0_OCELI|nr:EscU/YscU/HrcU family type III secretion system export apparatus switch protein [Oceanospirillum linum]OOV88554.1 hypothetical protein BTA35_0203400 [Oceanospirillum linum]SEF60621.1 flagellar biosynthesis protein [Oleiphilus messinensis]SMP06980.1 flagellar biosynthesis protein [Oceanospirillum linum]
MKPSVIQETPQSKPSNKKAVALQYEGFSTPRVTAKGEHLLAEQIVHLARENNIPVYEDSGLVQALAQVELGEEIPELLYMAIAEIIAFIYQLERTQSGTEKIRKDVISRRDMLKNKYKN